MQFQFMDRIGQRLAHVHDSLRLLQEEVHAGWPAGLVLGSLANYFMEGSVRWEIQWALFLIPVIIYGLMCMGQNFPKSEASTKGVGFGDMLSEFAAPVLLFLLLIHAMVGYVELGTDSWISQITGAIMANQVLASKPG